MTDCIFCKIVNKEIPTKFIDETENFLAFPDVNPQTPGHCLVIPKKHYANIFELPKELGNELVDFIKKIADIQVKKNNANSFKLAQNNGEEAGQVVMHLHFHIIPRKKGDSYRGV